jgi:hypothetical protein
MSDIRDISCTPPEIREAADVAIQNLLPTKSRKRNEVVYEKFNNNKIWFTKRHFSNLDVEICTVV